MPLREEEKRQVVNILRQFGSVQQGNAARYAALLTEKQQRALLAEYRDKVKPLTALADAAIAVAERAKPVTAGVDVQANATHIQIEADSLLVPEPESTGQ